MNDLKFVELLIEEYSSSNPFGIGGHVISSFSMIVNLFKTDRVLSKLNLSEDEIKYYYNRAIRNECIIETEIQDNDSSFYVTNHSGNWIAKEKEMQKELSTNKMRSTISFWVSIVSFIFSLFALLG